MNIIWLQCANSTNSVMKKELPHLDNLSIISARCQTAGRGQGDHSWYSSENTNLTFSILLRFPLIGAGELRAKDGIVVTQITTLSLHDYLLSKGISSRIKWTNDIWVGDKKISGILIENTVSGGMITESIVGIGLNVNEENWPENLPNPVSMKELTGETYSPEKELEELASYLKVRYNAASTLEGRERMKEKFERLVFRLEEKN